MADVTPSGECCLPPKRTRNRTNRRRKRGNRAGVAVKARAAELLEIQQLARGSKPPRGVLLSNLSYIESDVVSNGTSSPPLESALLCKPPDKEVADVPAPMTMLPPPPPIPPTTASVEELIQQSQWNLQQQEQHLLSLRQAQAMAAISLAMEQQMQKLLVETQLDMNEFDNLLQPIIDTCTKDAMLAGKNWMFSNAKTPPHCELMASHLRNRITADEAHFELRLHLIYLTNCVLHHCQRKSQRDLLAALQKVVVPIYCTSFLAVEEDKQQKITRLLLLWEKNSYFDEVTIQQLQSPALGLGQYQALLITEYAPVVQPVQMAFQQQIQVLKTQHEEFVNNLKQQQTQKILILKRKSKSFPTPVCICQFLHNVFLFSSLL
uniref:Calcium homeostasis endoplasmic reticulum protein-like n=1 Tax=Sinocyclocheilus grahami TaxID=75366 RepID=A0A672M709_SINGR